MKCQRCTKAATLHITEVLGEDQWEELHLCEECAHKYLYEPQQKSTAVKGGSSGLAASEEVEESGGLNKECAECGIKFADFRNTGRLGCPHDYQVFRDELVSLLENIHGETRHVGKTPRRQPQNRQTQTELTALRKQLTQAVNREAYEEAARLRDRIKKLEETL
jgi:protein arginine kinase activator